ncbi:hypothetical protein [Pseudomonas sp. CFBP 13719]|uniref:hypothetical protein n=1 Tax=Pseudomonas sp. CFBP 13719 TaxID=2775303 RepID=UPI001786BE2D|nr:hypothetical protein [Pseudomonas sp. CFBP 13719]MBD8680329.1 hypothetical protein [Pseudomonas sp. CFBP 13719]
MSLKDQGFKFCISPDKSTGRWLHPAERLALYAGWTDVTDWPEARLLSFVLPAPKQQELFAA